MSEQTTLFVKNFPRKFTNLDKTEFLQVFGGTEVKSLGKHAFVKFHNALQATDALQKIHQYDLLGNKLSVEYAKTSEDNFEISFSNEPEYVKECENLNEYVKNLYAINSKLNINQPPPPYLKYKYPTVSRDIIDNIGILLETNLKFYTQVLHLMNRMNLPTPFFVDPVHGIKRNSRDVEVQTYVTLIDEESEMESDEDVLQIDYCIPEIRKRKSLLRNKNPLKKFRSILNTEKNKKQKSDDRTKIGNSSKEVFTETNLIEKKKITIQIPKEIITKTVDDAESEETEELVSEDFQNQKSKIITKIELIENRLDPDQLKQIPVFKNYTAGRKSNKLYIKNISKDVVEEDMRRIFHYFIKHKTEEIKIVLLKNGRMKGQAFVTFYTPYNEEDIEKGIETMAEKALRMTNGFILKDKPLVVMFGK